MRIYVDADACPVREQIEDTARMYVVPVTEDASPAQMATALRQALCNAYPATKLKRTMKSIHYANAFADTALRECAFTLDDVEQYLRKH